MKNKSKIRIIGRREYIDFPDFNVHGIEAKIDTGAYRSALHCSVIEERIVNDAANLYFKLLDETHPEFNEVWHSVQEFQRKKIKSSSGDWEERYIIKTRIKMGRKTVLTTVSLTDRGSMRFPVLIGRKMLKGKFVVNVSLIHTGGLRWKY
jgi:hypothetical protein